MLLASGDLLPRQRARTQEPDVAGLKLKRQLLDRLVAIDPEPDHLQASLLGLVEEIGPPTGPTRAIALSFWEEWQTACVSPELVGHLLGQAALRTSGPEDRGRGR